MAKKKPTGFGTRLRELREAAGLSQAQLAEAAGLHLHGVTKLEQGHREPSWATVTALADGLGVSTEEFRRDHAEAPGPRGPGRPPKRPAGSAAPAPKRPRKGKGE
jgi:transcriptional regulator with XRE-family HTH domain